MILGYGDCNDVDRLKDDGVLRHVLDGDLVSQSTLSRFENIVTLWKVFKLSGLLVDS